MPQLRFFCVSIRRGCYVLAEVETAAEIAAVYRRWWGDRRVHWVAVQAERSTEAVAKVLAWAGRTDPERRPEIDRSEPAESELWRAMNALVTCGTCS